MKSLRRNGNPKYSDCLKSNLIKSFLFSFTKFSGMKFYLPGTFVLYFVSALSFSLTFHLMFQSRDSAKIFNANATEYRYQLNSRKIILLTLCLLSMLLFFVLLWTISSCIFPERVFSLAEIFSALVSSCHVEILFDEHAC